LNNRKQGGEKPRVRNLDLSWRDCGALALQQDVLTHTGCQKIIVDRVRGTVAERPGLTQIKELLRAGDTLVVWRLDRLGRSIKYVRQAQASA
jgi:DNA invertase Pin-like site-specific DNA recombinase